MNCEPRLQADLDEVFRPRQADRLTMPTAAEEVFRHGHWAPLRRKVLQAMLAAGIHGNRVESFVACGATCCVYFSSVSGEVRLQGSSCHDRFCQPCSAARGRLLCQAIRGRIPPNVRLRFLTLTLRHSSIPLADQLQRLRDAFTTLRNRKWWKDRVRGGVATLEVKVGEDGQWHPHLHMILQGEFMAKHELKKIWLAITGDSYILSIKCVTNSSHAQQDLSKYLCKYITKPAGLDVYTDQAKLMEYILAMRGQRILNFLGEWRGIMSDVEESEELPIARHPDWQRLGTLTEFVTQANAGDPFALNVMSLIRPPREEPPRLDFIEDAPS